MKPPPGTYNKMLEERLPGHGESLNELQPLGILLEGATGNGSPRLLLQIFSGTRLDPSFLKSSSARKTKALVKVTSKLYLNP